jgi:hypothetical protein
VNYTLYESVGVRAREVECLELRQAVQHSGQRDDALSAQLVAPVVVQARVRTDEMGESDGQIVR